MINTLSYIQSLGGTALAIVNKFDYGVPDGNEPTTLENTFGEGAFTVVTVDGRELALKAGNGLSEGITISDLTDTFDTQYYQARINSNNEFEVITWTKGLNETGVVNTSAVTNVKFIKIFKLGE